MFHHPLQRYFYPKLLKKIKTLRINITHNCTCDAQPKHTTQIKTNLSHKFNSTRKRKRKAQNKTKHLRKIPNSTPTLLRVRFHHHLDTFWLYISPNFRTQKIKPEKNQSHFFNLRSLFLYLFFFCYSISQLSFSHILKWVVRSCWPR